MSPFPERILIVADTGADYGQAMLHGAASLLAERLPGVRISTATPNVDADAKRFLGDYTRGVVAQVTNERIEALLAQTDIPVVNTSTSRAKTPFPSVCVDDVSAGATAAQHVVDRGYTSAIYLGYGDRAFSNGRLAGVRDVIGDETLPVLRTSWEYDEISAGLPDFLKNAAPPIAIIAASDQLARRASDIASDLSLLVGVDVVIVGINNDPIICEINTPTLSSVMLPFEQVGARAAAMLLDLIDGQSLDDPHIRLPALGVAQRQSSGLDAVADPELRAALAVVERTHGNTTVADMTAATAVTQRRIEQLFKQHLGQTPQQYLIRRRADRARHLLIETNLSVTQIAHRCGFSGASHMGVVLRKHFDATPTAIRKAFQAD